jgi:hypothetical protein
MSTKLLLLSALAAMALTGCETPETPKTPDPSQYAISVNADTGGGTIAVMADGGEVSQAAAGTRITLTATESTGCEFVRWSITGVTISDPTVNPLTFPMPEGRVTVDAEFFVEINGVKWATRNVGAPGTFAATPKEPGMFYQWGRKRGWIKDPLTAYDENGKINGAVWDSTYEEGNTWSPENDPSPTGWRLPTLQDIVTFSPELGRVTAERIGEFTGEDSMIYAAGYKFTDTTTGASMFLPAAGFLSAGDGSWGNTQSYGTYWTSTESGTDYDGACSLNFVNTGEFAPFQEFHRANAFLVRPVKK